ncbi:hypothetical protein GPECTOR_19g275 [Gonium pectorale]|uniref:non-specific serine/threonine protein kinase n=1 Tax=Gonium pectorale TaxID=33097 RepID=A0A150GJ69_GONPE|nr:hypothetical protein GPECTOR_19g275 [Gonium pectorale]|eukprot:KXZ49824.1 hypothetical protein GPECTOR_19g275 [Gonium pectorale]
MRSPSASLYPYLNLPLARVLVPMVSQEIQLQAALSEGCLGLVRMESALLSRSHLGLVMEYIDGGTLTQYVSRRTATRFERGGLHLEEDEARYFFRQLINAVEYLHKSHVAHRDLKMCNVVLTTRRPPTLKLCDFGFAKGWDEDSCMHTRIGTPVYMSPQLIEAQRDGKAYSATAADVWACGVLLYAMLLGRFPYDHTGHPDPNSSGAHVEVLNEQLKASDGGWERTPRVAPHIQLLSNECRDLLGQLLNMDEAKRITIPNIRKHPWFTAAMPDHLDAAIREAEEKQGKLDAAMEAAHESMLKKRNTAVHELVLMAGHEFGSPAAVAAAAAATGGGALPFAAIFECGSEGECPTTPGSRCTATTTTCGGGGGNTGVVNGSSPRLQKLSPRTGAITAATTATSLAGGLSPAPSTREKAPSDCEAEVIVIDLTAVARRTKSDGLLLLAPSPSMLGGGEEVDSYRLGDSGEDTEDACADSSTACNTGAAAAAAAAAAAGGTSSAGGNGPRLLQTAQTGTAAPGADAGVIGAAVQAREVVVEVQGSVEVQAAASTVSPFATLSTADAAPTPGPAAVAASAVASAAEHGAAEQRQ